MRTPGPLLCSIPPPPPPGSPGRGSAFLRRHSHPSASHGGTGEPPPAPHPPQHPAKDGAEGDVGGGEGKKPVPEQRFVFLSSQHCYGDFKQDGGALPPHRSPACTHRSPFPRKRGGKGGGGLHRAGALHLPAGATPSSAGTASGFPTATHIHTHRTPPPQVHRARTLWGCGSSGRGSQHSGSPASIFPPPPPPLPAFPAAVLQLEHPPPTPHSAIGDGWQREIWGWG